MRRRFGARHGFAVIDMGCTTREQDQGPQAGMNTAQQGPPERVTESAEISLDGHHYRFETQD
jgi:hypothetical protein